MMYIVGTYYIYTVLNCPKSIMLNVICAIFCGILNTLVAIMILFYVLMYKQQETAYVC